MREHVQWRIVVVLASAILAASCGKTTDDGSFAVDVGTGPDETIRALRDRQRLMYIDTFGTVQSIALADAYGNLSSAPMGLAIESHCMYETWRQAWNKQPGALPPALVFSNNGNYYGTENSSCVAPYSATHTVSQGYCQLQRSLCTVNLLMDLATTEAQRTLTVGVNLDPNANYAPSSLQTNIVPPQDSATRAAFLEMAARGASQAMSVLYTVNATQMQACNGACTTTLPGTGGGSLGNGTLAERVPAVVRLLVEAAREAQLAATRKYVDLADEALGLSSDRDRAQLDSMRIRWHAAWIARGGAGVVTPTMPGIENLRLDSSPPCVPMSLETPACPHSLS